MKNKTRYRVKIYTRGQNTAYNPTYFDVLQDRVSHLSNFEKPSFYNKRTDPDKNFNFGKR